MQSTLFSKHLIDQRCCKILESKSAANQRADLGLQNCLHRPDCPTSPTHLRRQQKLAPEPEESPEASLDLQSCHPQRTNCPMLPPIHRPEPQPMRSLWLDTLEQLLEIRAVTTVQVTPCHNPPIPAQQMYSGLKLQCTALQSKSYGSWTAELGCPKSPPTHLPGPQHPLWSKGADSSAVQEPCSWTVELSPPMS